MHLIGTVLLLDPNRRRPSRQWLVGLLACLCLFAVVLTATAEAQHIHADGTREAQRCTVCVAAHSPTLLARVALLAPQASAQPLPVAGEARDLLARFPEPDSIRPPPAR